MKNLSLLILTLVLCSCSFEVPVMANPTPVPTTNSTPIPQGVSFEKKQECAKLIPGIRKDLNERYSPDSGLNTFADLGEVFYSPKANSCLYSYSTSQYFKGGIIEYSYLIDALTNRQITTATSLMEDKKDPTTWDWKKEFRDKVESYK